MPDSLTVGKLCAYVAGDCVTLETPNGEGYATLSAADARTLLGWLNEAVNNPIASAARHLNGLSWSERKSAIEELKSATTFCWDCCMDSDGKACHCQNDE